MTTPIFIPVSKKEDRCPNCNKKENIIETCKHCGYVYPEEDSGLGGCLFIIVLALLAVYIIITLSIWFVNHDKSTLLDVLIGQWKWITSLKIY